MRDPRRAWLRDFHRARGRGRRIELPDDVVRIDRATPWGNQYRIGDPFPKKTLAEDPSLHNLRMNRADVVELYRVWLDVRLFDEPDFLELLRGKRLACWCHPNEACHADVILEALERSAVPA